MFDAVRVGAFEVDLIDCHDDGDARRLGVVYRLGRLRHDTVVRSDHQYGNVRDFGAAGAHRRERFVARRVEEREALAVDDNRRSADVLRNPARFAFGYACVAYGVEETRLAMVDVAHDRNDRCTRLKPFARLRYLSAGEDRRYFLRGDLGFNWFKPEVRGDDGGGVKVDRLVDGRHHPVLHQLLDHFDGADAHALAELFDRDYTRKLNRSLVNRLTGRGLRCSRNHNSSSTEAAARTAGHLTRAGPVPAAPRSARRRCGAKSGVTLAGVGR